MKNGLKVFCFALILGLAVAMAGCSRKKEPNKPQDLESVRASLREQVASGELTRGGNDKDKLSPTLEALGEKLKEQVAKGELTGEEAKAAWMKAARRAKSSAKGTKDSAKETE